MSQNVDTPNCSDAADGDLQAWFDSDPVLVQAQRDGVDVWALWANLQRPAEERIRRHQISLNRFRMLYNAARTTNTFRQRRCDGE